ncbi:MAG TPA: response regulator transcription factor [Candidatus Limnocylindria bacterium]|jgi:DNA-binding NarL/FixJ family response regulator|nr:response regulator transcription factor [Candidatus Limnocylindria bacterium]
MSPATRVQIVDDHFLFAEALGSVIREDPDYDLVGIAVTGPQAISIAQDKQPDVILLDFHLPGYSAESLIPRLRTIAPRSRILILTSDTGDTTLAQGVQAGVMGFLTKDRALDDVMLALEAVAEGQSVLTPEQLAKARAVSANVAPGEALTSREVEILRLVSRGRDTQSIADQLVISTNTVRTHMQNIFAKLGAHSKLEAVTMANQRGLLR